MRHLPKSIMSLDRITTDTTALTTTNGHRQHPDDTQQMAPTGVQKALKPAHLTMMLIAATRTVLHKISSLTLMLIERSMLDPLHHTLLMMITVLHTVHSTLLMTVTTLKTSDLTLKLTADTTIEIGDFTPMMTEATSAKPGW